MFNHVPRGDNVERRRQRRRNCVERADEILHLERGPTPFDSSGIELDAAHIEPPTRVCQKVSEARPDLQKISRGDKLSDELPFRHGCPMTALVEVILLVAVRLEHVRMLRLINGPTVGEARNTGCHLDMAARGTAEDRAPQPLEPWFELRVAHSAPRKRRHVSTAHGISTRSGDDPAALDIRGLAMRARYHATKTMSPQISKP